MTKFHRFMIGAGLASVCFWLGRVSCPPDEHTYDDPAPQLQERPEPVGFGKPGGGVK